MRTLVKGEKSMKLRKTPIASAVAVALMSIVTPAQAQSANSSVDTPKSQTQPDAATAQAAKDKAKGATKPSATKDAEASADAKTAAGEPQVLAQATTPPPATTPPTVLPRETIRVTGFRYSVERSLETKRNADSVVDVVTADDIGALPDRNIA